MTFAGEADDLAIPPLAGLSLFLFLDALAPIIDSLRWQGRLLHDCSHILINRAPTCSPHSFDVFGVELSGVAAPIKLISELNQ
ncbi:MAG: hypothetical protein AAGA71_01430 [Pseudomonadota bacterium]